jgi:hypothetical protein
MRLGWKQLFIDWKQPDNDTEELPNTQRLHLFADLRMIKNMHTISNITIYPITRIAFSSR